MFLGLYPVKCLYFMLNVIGKKACILWNNAMVFNECSVLGLLKTHNLSFQDCESLQAVFDKERSPNVLRAQPRFEHFIHLLTYCIFNPIPNHIFLFFSQSSYLSFYLCLNLFLYPAILLDYLWTPSSTSPPLWRR